MSRATKVHAAFALVQDRCCSKHLICALTTKQGGRPATHISGMTIKSDVDTITPIAWVEKAVEGLSITFSAKLDGKTIARLGECPISSGQSSCSAIKFRQPKWNIGQPFLFHLVGELNHNGKIIDQYSIRTGARSIEWDKTSLRINQKPTKLLPT